MKWRVMVVAAVLGAGCQTSPHAAREVTSTHALAREPLSASVCIARNMDAQRPAFNTRINQGRDPVLVEVRVNANEPVALVQLRIRDNGSAADVTTLPALAEPRAALVATMIQGC